MCHEYPGPRCSNHGLILLQKAEKEFSAARKDNHNTSLAYVIAEQNLYQAQYEYNTTPDGISAMKEEAEKDPGNRGLTDRYNRHIRIRNQQLEALNEQRNGRADKIAEVVTASQRFYDLDEMGSIVSAVRRNSERAAIANGWDDVGTDEARTTYLATLNRIESAVHESGNLTPEVQKKLSDLREMKTPTSAATLKTYADSLKALNRSRSALKNELATVATIQNVPHTVAKAYYDAYRNQYQTEFAGLAKKSERPDPPKEWVMGDYISAGYQNDPASAFAPSDEASMYAMYRLRVDDKAIPDYLKTSKGFAAVNLTEDFDNEASNPKPSLVFYTARGRKTGEYQMRPRSLKADLPELATQLQGKTVVTQDKHKESAWLQANSAEYGLNSVPVMTLKEMSRKHLNLPSNDLKLICEKTGIEFDDKTLSSETETTMKAYLGVRKKAQSQWDMKISRKKAPALTDVPSSFRW